MGAFWKTLWGSLVSVGGIVALFITARAENYLWAFWLTFGTAFVIATGWTLGPRLFNWIKYVREYPNLLKRAGQLQSKNEDLTATISALEKSATANRLDGIRHGEARVLGAIKAAGLRAQLRLTAADFVDGKVLLAAESHSQVPEGAWFVVESAVQSVEKGIVEVVECDLDSKSVVLVCVEPTVPGFWKALAERAESDPSPPHGMRLVPFTLPMDQLSDSSALSITGGASESSVTEIADEAG